jgi:hypothetical protein
MAVSGGVLVLQWHGAVRLLLLLLLLLLLAGACNGVYLRWLGQCMLSSPVLYFTTHQAHCTCSEWWVWQLAADASSQWANAQNCCT